MSLADATCATTTETITNGMTVSPCDPSSRVASRTETNGSLSIAVLIAPTPMANPATRDSPGAWESRMPPAAPTNIAGRRGLPGNC